MLILEVKRMQNVLSQRFCQKIDTLHTFKDNVLSIIIFFLFIVIICLCTCPVAHMCKAKDGFVKLDLSFHLYVAAEIEVRLSDLRGMCPYLRSDFSGPLIIA